MSNPADKLTPEELRALYDYARGYRKWKHFLCLDWARGLNVGPLLQSVRNKIGPSGLYKLRLVDEMPMRNGGSHD